MKKWIQSLKQTNILKSIVHFVVGMASYPGLVIFNKLKITGTENFKDLPRRNILFVSNHQTYFADVIAFFHTFGAVKWGKKNRLGLPYYLLNPFTRVYYVAAGKTMKSSWLSKLFTLGGAITVQRAWVPEAGEKRKGLDVADTRKIAQALENNWVLTFPQGTTKPFAPGRKGTAFIIKQYKPIVIPVVIDGFSTAFDKRGLKMKKRNTLLSLNFKEPLTFSDEDSLDQILERVMESIEQIKKPQ
ncbi:MAG: lysophospholipid acyltransferase family protein [Ginsengibacter sp.]